MLGGVGGGERRRGWVANSWQNSCNPLNSSPPLLRHHWRPPYMYYTTAQKKKRVGSPGKLPPWASHQTKERQTTPKPPQRPQRTTHFAALQLQHSGGDLTSLARLASLLSRSGLPRLWTVGRGAPRLHAKVPCPAGNFPQTSAQFCQRLAACAAVIPR